MNPIRRARRIAATAVAVAGVAAAIAPSLATGAEGDGTNVPTIRIVGRTLKSLHFAGPKTINEGEELRIVNESNPKVVGPQTFSLVEAEEMPQTRAERESCLKAKHICRAILGWQRIKGDGPAKVNPVEAGEEGWDTLGTREAKGDSWFTGRTPGASFEQRVTAGANAAPVTLTFMSAFDPLLRGQIKVLPVR